MVNPNPGVSETSAAESVAGIKSEQVAAKKAAVEGYTNDTKVDSVKSLKEKAPEVYKAMIEGVAQSIIGKMRAHAARLKKLMREASNR